MTRSISGVITGELRVDNIRDDAGEGITEGWDSLATVNIILAIEEEFNISISTEDFLKLKSFGGIYRYVKGKIEWVSI